MLKRNAEQSKYFRYRYIYYAISINSRAHFGASEILLKLYFRFAKFLIFILHIIFLFPLTQSSDIIALVGYR